VFQMVFQASVSLRQPEGGVHDEPFFLNPAYGLLNRKSRHQFITTDRRKGNQYFSEGLPILSSPDRATRPAAGKE
jgi:hypothetical protein